MATNPSAGSSNPPSSTDALAAKAEDVYQTAAQALREQADTVVRRLRPQIDAVSTYARTEPTKAMLMSAATGAALMGLIALIVRSGNRSSPVPAARHMAGSTLSAIREAALDLADRAHSVATQALDSGHQRAADALSASQKRASEAVSSTQKRAADAVSSAQQRATDAAEAVSDTVADAWHSLRDQAGPVVDKLRPQIDAVAKYAREEPARAALGVVAAGAVLVGLMALIRGSQADD